MQPKGANKNIVDQAIFSKEGPNLSRPADTSKPRVIPKDIDLQKKRRNKLSFNKDIPTMERSAILREPRINAHESSEN